MSADRQAASLARDATGTEDPKADDPKTDSTPADVTPVALTPVDVTPAEGASATDVVITSKSKSRPMTASQPVAATSVQSQPVGKESNAQVTSTQAKTAVIAAETVTADHTPSVVADTRPAAPPAAVKTVAPTLQPAPSRIGFVSGLISGLLTAVGLNPQAAGGPTTPAEPPALWALLGWVRRELGQVIDPAQSSTATATATTSLIVPPSASTVAAVPAVTAAPLVSVLGTPEQLQAERIAAGTVDTLPVALLKLVLRFGFQASAQQQFSPVGGPDQANLDRLGAAVDEYAMATAFQQQILNSNDPKLVAQVAPPHTWYGQTVGGSRILYDNPDTIYRFAGVNAASSYVITGRFTDPKPAETTFSVLTGLNGITTTVLNAKDLQINNDGTFTITASREPANGRPNHLQLTNDATLIATRNTLADWSTEDPVSLEIERVGGPPNSLFSQLGGFAIPGLGPLVVGNPLLTSLVSLIPPLADPPPLLRGAVTAVIMALGIQREATYISVATSDPVTGEPIEPNVLKSPARNAQFLATQLQSAGYFQLADDEALVVTIYPGNAGYFVLPVTDDWTISKDYWNEQTSLNKAQSIVDQDSTKYTIVVSKSDPGVANWVSTGGLNQGTISMRFQDLDSGAPDDLPMVSSQVVKLDELNSVLPAGTVYYTGAQRQEQLAIRKAGFDRRFAPFAQP